MNANDYQVGGSHYQSSIQHWDYVVANDIPYLEAQVIKYLTRWRRKGGHNDLEKAKQFLHKLFETQGLAWDPPAAAACEGLQRGVQDQAGVFGGSLSASQFSQKERIPESLRKR